jgi:hypothetical protein
LKKFCVCFPSVLPALSWSSEDDERALADSPELKAQRGEAEVDARIRFLTDGTEDAANESYTERSGSIRVAM